MLTAQVDGELVVARRTIERGRAYECRDCRWPVVFKNGPQKMPHFAHRPGSGCDFGEGETEAHRQAKFALYERLLQHPDVSEVEMECTLKGGVARADIGAFIRGEYVAFEIQRSNLSVEKITHRTETYARFGIAVMWIALASERLYFDASHFRNVGQDELDRGERQYSPTPWEKWLHAAYMGRVFYWKRKPKFPVDHGDYTGVIAAHYEPHMIEVEEREWYEKGGELQYAGGYERHSKRWRDVRISDPFDVVSDCKSVVAPAFRSGGVIEVPVRKIWTMNSGRWVFR